MTRRSFFLRGPVGEHPRGAVRVSTNGDTRTAWLRTEGDCAVLCAWCGDLAAAEARARSAGLRLSHGICPQCAREKMGVEIAPDSFAALPQDNPRTA